jgi:hypothetical protein
MPLKAFVMVRSVPAKRGASRTTHSAGCCAFLPSPRAQLILRYWVRLGAYSENGCATWETIRRRKGHEHVFCCHDVRRPYGRCSDCHDGGMHAEHSSGAGVPGGSALGSCRLRERQVGSRPLPGPTGAIKRDKMSLPPRAPAASEGHLIKTYKGLISTKIDSQRVEWVERSGTYRNSRARFGER